ncbi:MAG: hypothetical protein ACR2NU_14705 [Aeoliella sp.]
MSPREKKLTAAVVLLVLLWGGNWAWLRYSRWHQTAQAANRNAESALGAAKLEQLKTNDAVEKIKQWREKSLPAIANVAQSQYRAWLIERLQEARLKIDDVTPTGSGQRSGAYQGLTYTIDAAGDLTAVVKFLDSFYRSDQLHKISVLRLTPQEQGDLRVTLTIEALVVSGTERKSGLVDLVSDRLALESVDQYVSRVVSRDPFKAYTPPKPPPKVVERVVVKPREKPKFDDSKHAKFTGVVSYGNELQAWVHVQTKGDMLHVKRGDDLKVGLFEGQVVDVRPQQLVIMTAEGMLAIRIGKTLREGVVLPDDAGI